jgi:hypothetical protein
MSISKNLMLFVGFLSVSVLTAGNVHAASACKGKEQKICLTDADCSWVNSYERSDGKTVNAFCRTKAKKAKTASAKTADTAKKS